jgi:colanic acid biosynthesis glycosyl transferase WcaI
VPQPVLRFINQHYAPDVASTGQHLTDIAEYLARNGVAVEVLTGRAHYSGGQLDAPGREVLAGVRVRRFRTAGLGRDSRVGRVFDYALFYAQVAWATWTGPDPEGTVYLTTPPLLAVIGWIGLALRGRRYGIWSMDLHPDAEIAAGMLRAEGVAGRLLTWLNDCGYRHADFVIDLGPHMRQRILAKGVSASRAHTVPVWAGEEVGGSERPSGAFAANGGALRRRLGVDGKWVVMYSGNAGVVHDFAAILDAIDRLRDDASVHFLFVGGGPRRAEIEAFIRARDVRNFTYLDYVTRAELPQVLAAGDMHLISLRAAFAGISVPGKLYGIMAAARPALFVGPAACETADTIREAECGAVIDPADHRSGGQGTADAADRIVTVIRQWRDDPAAARAAGARGRAAYTVRYQPAVNCAAFARVLADTWPHAFARPVDQGGGVGLGVSGRDAAASMVRTG